MLKLVPNTPAENPPAPVLSTRPCTPHALAALERVVPIMAPLIPVPLLFILNNVPALACVFKNGSTRSLANDEYKE